MKLSLSKTHNPNYVASVVKVKEIKPIKGADKIVQVIVDGFSVVVSNTTKVGDVFIFCPIESALNSQILKENNLYSDMYLNQNYADLTEEEALAPDLELPTGFFNKHGRVKPINLRKTPSQGFLASPEMFKCVNGGVTPDLSKHVGKTFDTVNDILFIEKYIPSNLRINNDQRKGKQKRINDKFSFHYNTSVINRNLHKLVINNFINITTKLHGTSAVFGHYNETQGLLNKIKALFGFKPTSYVFSSRKVIKQSNSNSIWSKVGNAIKDSIEVDTTIYGEIVGYYNGGCIQKGYDYGCRHSECVFVPYRVVKHDKGRDRELTIAEVVDFTESLVSTDNNVTVKPLDVLFSGTMLELLDRYKIDFTNREDDSYWQDELLDALKNDKEFLMEKNEPLCKNKVPREGIVLRIGTSNPPEAFKLKCQSFYLYETKQLDSGDGCELDE